MTHASRVCMALCWVLLQRVQGQNTTDSEACLPVVADKALFHADQQAHVKIAPTP